MTNPNDYSTRETMIVSGHSEADRAAIAEAEALAMRESDGLIRWNVLDECVKQNISEDIALAIYLPAIDSFYVDDKGDIKPNGAYKSISEFVTLSSLQAKSKRNPLAPTYTPPEIATRNFEIERHETIDDLHKQLNYFASVSDMKNYRRIRAEIDKF